MYVSIAGKEFEVTETVARFTELQKYFASTRKNLGEAASQDRVSKVRERNALADQLGVPWHAIPRPIEQFTVSAGHSQM